MQNSRNLMKVLNRSTKYADILEEYVHCIMNISYPSLGKQAKEIKIAIINPTYLGKFITRCGGYRSFANVNKWLIVILYSNTLLYTVKMDTDNYHPSSKMNDINRYTTKTFWNVNKKDR